MKIYVLNYQLAQRFEFNEPTIVIRISDPGCTKADGNNASQKLQPSEFPVLEFCYEFEDIDLTVYEGDEAVYTRLSQRPIMTPEIAKKMVDDFGGVLAASNTPFNTLAVHCNAGISRSVATAFALTRKFGIVPEWQGRRTIGLMKAKADKFDEYIGNRWVYRKILEV